MKQNKIITAFFIPLLLSLIWVVIITGCVSRKKTILFQNIGKDSIVDVKLPPDYLIQSGDVLDIRVQSLDKKASAFIEGMSDVQNQNTLMQSEQNLFYSGYEVSPFGAIHLPYIDSIKVVGLTTTQIARIVSDSLAPLVKDALVTVRLASFRVNVLGEVQSSGTFLFYHSHVTIFEALALAKPTEYYNATNVVITRQMGENRIKIDRIDLTSPKIISSPFYYLRPNDQIYIEPLKVKKYGFNVFPYALLLSTLSTVMLIYSILKK